MEPFVQDAAKLCECGCGEPAPIATYSHAARGWVKGEPKRFVNGHAWRGRARKPRRYEIQDCGYETPCWVWLLHRDDRGYGRVTLTDRAPELAHRAYFREQYGWLPPVLHHKCENTSCVRPDHMQPLDSHAEHIRVEQSTRTHCRRGHAYSEHGRFHKGSTARYCRACERDNERERRAALR